MSRESAATLPAVLVWSVPKSGRAETENEDAYAVNCETRRFAVADGASTSARPEVWSRLLVDTFVDEDSDALDLRALDKLREQWRKKVWRAGLPWFAEEKLHQGAAAAFVGLAIEDHEKTTAPGYRVRAIGDSCLFHMRGGRLLLLVPPLKLEDFSRFPTLLHTDPEMSVAAGDGWEARGTYQLGDVFILATDTIAKALLQKYERALYGARLVTYLETRERFDQFVSLVRQSGSDDDMTACVVAL